jgi:four helix bundle protein
MVNSYRDLVLWGVAVDFIKDVYGLTKVFPQDERYGLVQQMRRAAVSIVSNLAEGSARKNTKELI